MKRNVILLVCVVLAGCFGIWVSQTRASEPKMVHQDPVTMTEPFVINLNDRYLDSYIKIAVGFTLRDIPEDVYQKLHPDSGHGAQTPVSSLATDPVLRDIVITTVSRYGSKTLRTEAGKKALQADILSQIDTTDKAQERSYIQGVLFTEFAIQ